MGNSNPRWVINGEDHALFGTASGLGATSFILSTKEGTKGFVDARNSLQEARQKG